MAGIAPVPAGRPWRREFWVAQLVHQAPMLVAMTLMATVLRSALGLLAIVAGLWLVALFRANAARTTLAAREFLVDVLAMALVLIVPLIHAAGSSGTAMGMTMTGAKLGGEMSAVVVIVGWAGTRLLMARAPASDGSHAASFVSGSCCAVGLLAMLLI